MAVTVQVSALIGYPDPTQVRNDQWRIEFSDHPAALEKLWGVVLCLALRDHATSVHYHSWRTDGRVAYVRSGVWQAMPQTIPAHLSGPMIAAARSLFTPPGWRRWCGRAFGVPSCGVVELDVWGHGPVVWDVAVWSSGGRARVELFRITPFTAAEQRAEAAEQRAERATEIARDVPDPGA